MHGWAEQQVNVSPSLSLSLSLKSIHFWKNECKPRRSCSPESSLHPVREFLSSPFAGGREQGMGRKSDPCSAPAPVSFLPAFKVLWDGREFGKETTSAWAEERQVLILAPTDSLPQQPSLGLSLSTHRA